MTTYKTWAHRQGWKFRVRTQARYWFSKWPLANALNRLKRTCWSDLVDWALHKNGEYRDEDESYRLRYRLSGGERCRAESADPDTRSCYCGKFVDGGIRPKDWTP